MTPKESAKGIDSVGWIFWLLCFVAFLGPCLYFSWQRAYESVSLIVPLGLGSAIAGIGAGFMSWVVNMALQNRARKRQQMERKQTKKKRK